MRRGSLIIRSLTLVTLITLARGAGPARAQEVSLEVCNTGTREVRAAVVHSTERPRYVSEGWIVIAVGRCVGAVPLSRGLIFVAFAAADEDGLGLIDDEPAAGEAAARRAAARSFCVRPDAQYEFFGTLAELRRCADDRGRVVPFSPVVPPLQGVKRLRHNVAVNADSVLVPFPDTPRAYYTLGKSAERGGAKGKDLAAAAEWYRKAADQGHVLSQIALARLYEKGQGVPQDYDRSMTWYVTAAESGNPIAQTAVGFFYAKGLGRPVNGPEAVKWYLRAAAQRYAIAQHNLGHMYEEGTGVPVDLEAARVWYRAAVASGHEESKRDLERVSK